MLDMLVNSEVHHSVWSASRLGAMLARLDV
jgi:hypothetical protein